MRENSFPIRQQLLSYSFNSLFCTEHVGPLLFSSQHDSHCHLISLAQLSSVLTFILHWTTLLLGSKCLMHFKPQVYKPKQVTKKVRHWQITEPLTQPTVLKIAKSTSNEIQTTDITIHYAVFSNFLIPPVIKFYGLISTVPKTIYILPSLSQPSVNPLL